MVQHLPGAAMVPMPWIHEWCFYRILVQRHEADRGAAVFKDPDLQISQHFVPDDRHEGVDISGRKESVRRQHGAAPQGDQLVGISNVCRSNVHAIAGRRCAASARPWGSITRPRTTGSGRPGRPRRGQRLGALVEGSLDEAQARDHLVDTLW